MTQRHSDCIPSDFWRFASLLLVSNNIAWYKGATVHIIDQRQCSSFCLRWYKPRSLWRVGSASPIYGYLHRFGASLPVHSTKFYSLVTEAGVRELLAQGRTWQHGG